MKNFFTKFKSVIVDFGKGICIGIAAIVPGVSGGTLAVLLKVYDKMIEAIGNIFKHFKKSFKTLLPIGLGVLFGILALVFPLKYAKQYVPLPLVSLFVGFIIGGLPGLFDKVNRKPNVSGCISALIALAIVIGICFIPTGGNFDIANMNWTGYLLFFVVGVVGSCALVVPGISGSMLLLILGFWDPIIEVASQLMKFTNVGSNLLILGLFALGCLVGFIIISNIMSILLKKFEYQTFMAIIAFIVGSIFSIYYTLDNPITDIMPLYAHIIASVIALIIGLAFSLSLTLYSIKKSKLELTVEPVGNDNE